MKRFFTKVSSLIFIPVLFIYTSMFLASCDKEAQSVTATPCIVYVQTNNFNDNQNAVLAYRDNGDGNLQPITGSPFLTKGSGVGNPKQILGPLDSDYELRLSYDKKYLLAVNSGSNTIAVFLIRADGSLEHVPGSPFSSGGQTPAHIDVYNKWVFVVNKSDDPLHTISMLPNYSTFTIDDAGKLTPVSGGKFETTAGSSPSNGLVSRNGKFLFGTDFLGFTLSPAVGTLRSFEITTAGTLTPLAGTPYVLPMGAMPDNGALGLWQHPSGSALYVGLPAQGKVGVFAVNNATGALTMQSAVSAGKAACWLRSNNMGDHLYVLNSGDNTVQLFNTSNPLSPVSVQTLELKNSGPEYPGGGSTVKTSECFSLHLSPDESTLYVVSQHTNTDFSIGNYNYLHTVQVAADGKLTEMATPVQLPVPSNVRPKGLVVIKGS